jgi:hypothetical protein
VTSIVAFVTIVVLSCIICHPFPLIAQGGSDNQLSTRPSLPELGTRFEAVEGIFSLPSIDCLGCEFGGIVEKLSESQYSIRGEVVADSISTVIPVSVSGILNINGSAINGTLSISDEHYIIEGTSTTYSPTCSYCKQTLDIRGQSLQGNDVLSANVPLHSIK